MSVGQLSYYQNKTYLLGHPWFLYILAGALGVTFSFLNEAKMSKRLIDTNFFEHPFIESLDRDTRDLYQFLFLKADHAGIVMVTQSFLRSAAITLKSSQDFNTTSVFSRLNEGKMRVLEIQPGKWFMIGFIDHQYGGILKEKCIPHLSALKILEKEGLIEKYFIKGVDKKSEACFTLSEELLKGCLTLRQPLGKGCLTLINKDKDLDKDKEYPPTVKQIVSEYFGTLDENLAKRYEKNRDEYHRVCDLLLKDGYSDVDIRGAVLWARHDSFWRGNFISFSKLRKVNEKAGVKHIDIFLEKMKSGSDKKPRGLYGDATEEEANQFFTQQWEKEQARIKKIEGLKNV